MNKGKIMRKLLGQQTPTAESIDTTAAESPQLRPNASQNTTYSTGESIACLDRSPDGRRAIVAGSRVFKTLRVDGLTITEDVDLRAIISAYATTHDPSAASTDQLNIRSAVWSHGIMESTIITASGNGRITVYDLNRRGDGLEVARIQEHQRQVHKLAINPFKGNWLLSGSQDGSVKSFDLRTPLMSRNGPTFRMWHNFKANADAVRDVKWSPTDGMEFACSTDTGAVLKWDIRKPGVPVLKINAHQNTCTSISWHPDGEHLVSGGIDQHCYVWDVSKAAERGQKPRYAFSTPAPASIVAWRPPCWSATAHGNRAAQVLVVYDDTNPTRYQNSIVHLWDLARPTMPFKEIEHWETSPTGVFWSSRDLLWSVDRDGQFTQTDIAFVPKYLDRRSLSTFSFSSNGDVLMLLEERHGPRRPRPSRSSVEMSPTFQAEPSPMLLSISRSDSEEDVVGSFLGARRKRHRRQGSRRSTQSMSTTPPNLTGMLDAKVMPLEDALKVTGIYKPQQAMALGHTPAVIHRSIYKYFSNQYLERIFKDGSTNSLRQPVNARLRQAMEDFGNAVEKVGHYRLAQTWRLLAHGMDLLLTRRAEYHRQTRLMTTRTATPNRSKSDSKLRTDAGQVTPSRTKTRSPLRRPQVPSAKGSQNGDFDSTSNVQTPVMRPKSEDIVQETTEAMQTPLADVDDPLELPEAAEVTSPVPIPVPEGAKQTVHAASSVEGYDFYGMETYSPKLAYAAPQKKQPLRLDYPVEKDTSRRVQPLLRHDSGESFQMFSTSADSHHGKFLSSSESDPHSIDTAHGRALRDKVSSWESSFKSNPEDSAAVDDNGPANSESSAEQHTPSTSVESRATSDEHTRYQRSLPTFNLQEASFSADNHKSSETHLDHEPLSPPYSVVSTNPEIIESDYIPWSNDPPFLLPALDPTILVQRLIDFEAQTSPAHASAMLLILRPHLPSSSIDEFQAPAILTDYHSSLISMKLFEEATLLRKACVPLYPSIYGSAQENVNVSFFCTDCNKPFDPDPLIPNSVWRCSRCRKGIDACPICWKSEYEPGAFSKEDVPVEVSLWWSCPGCGHGGHTACMQAWHAPGTAGKEGDKYSGGCCPLEGCIHPCLPGRERNERWAEKAAAKQRELDMAVKENTWQRGAVGVMARPVPKGVRKDAREVGQSRAVEGVRVALGVGGGAVSGGGSLERKKSVKLVAPGEQM